MYKVLNIQIFYTVHYRLAPFHIQKSFLEFGTCVFFTFALKHWNRRKTILRIFFFYPTNAYASSTDVELLMLRRVRSILIAHKERNQKKWVKCIS